MLPWDYHITINQDPLWDLTNKNISQVEFSPKIQIQTPDTFDPL